MHKKPLISIVVPVFNEEENVRPLYDAVKKELEKISKDYDYEFVFTDNRSTDRTFEYLAEIARNDSKVRAARFSRNFGYQKSISTGYRLAAGDAAIELDCDLQDAPAMIHEFLAKWREGYKVVYGIRNTRQENPFITRLREWFYRLMRFLSDDNLPLDAGDFRLVDRTVLNHLKRIRDANPYLRGVISNMGFNQIGIPYARAPRRQGKSKFDFFKLISLALDGIVSHSIVPLRCATFLGFAISLGLILYFLGLVVLVPVFNLPWPRGFATISVLILISISVNALFLGIIGEYLGRIYQQVKGGGETIIDQTINLPESAAVRQ